MNQEGYKLLAEQLQTLAYDSVHWLEGCLEASTDWRSNIAINGPVVTKHLEYVSGLNDALSTLAQNYQLDPIMVIPELELKNHGDDMGAAIFRRSSKII